MVSLTVEFYKRNYIEGLFLSSGIIRNADHTMEEMLRVARTLRQVHRFRGYIHLKTIPEASPWLIEQAGLWADRLSINLELPSAESLTRLAPEKDGVSIRKAMGQMHDRMIEARAEKQVFSPAGQSTQVIVGADDTNDAQVLETSAALYGDYKLKRVYYSAFSPIPDSSAILPLEAAADAAGKPALSGRLAAALLWLRGRRDCVGRGRTACSISPWTPSSPGR